MAGRTPTISKLMRAAAILVAAVLLAALSSVGAEMLAPALALAALVVLELFTGERSVQWLRRMVRRLRRRRPVAQPPRIRARAGRPSPAGLLRAFALAMRPPPLAPSPR